MWQRFWENSQGLLAIVSKRSQFLSYSEKEAKIFLATNMAFTAYIFQEDYDRLTKQEITHASQQQRGGSLFGQWTSTGNPVIHRVMSFSHSQSSRDAAARELYDGFRVCYIGEWRPVQASSHNDMQARERLRGREPLARFLVLDVSRTDIVPFLLNRQTAQQERGRLEKLPGKNPFNKRESFQERMPRSDYHDPLRYQWAQEGQPKLSHQVPGASQFQEAITTVPQWYSADEGSKNFQKVLQGIKEIAMGDVDITRDTRSQDISLSFVEKAYRKKWEIKFPADFPAAGAVLIENPGPYEPKGQPQRGCDKVSQAVKNIISCIRRGSLLT